MTVYKLSIFVKAHLLICQRRTSASFANIRVGCGFLLIVNSTNRFWGKRKGDGGMHRHRPLVVKGV